MGVNGSARQGHEQVRQLCGDGSDSGGVRGSDSVLRGKGTVSGTLEINVWLGRWSHQEGLGEVSRTAECQWGLGRKVGREGSTV